MKKLALFLLITLATPLIVNAAGWKSTVSNDFSTASNISGWEFTLPWNSTYKTTDYLLENGYLELQMLQTDKGGHVLSPKFQIDGNIQVTVKHYLHQEGGNPFVGSVSLMDESAVPTYTGKSINSIGIRFENSNYSPDNVCAAYDIPQISDAIGCISNKLEGITKSSSFYNRWIITVIRYNQKTGRVTIDYENDKKIDFDGIVNKASRFIPTRIAFSTYGWWTGHFHRIDSVKIESMN